MKFTRRMNQRTEAVSGIGVMYGSAGHPPLSFRIQEPLEQATRRNCCSSHSGTGHTHTRTNARHVQVQMQSTTGQLKLQ